MAQAARFQKGQRVYIVVLNFPIFATVEKVWPATKIAGDRKYSLRFGTGVHVMREFEIKADPATLTSEVR